MDNKVVDISRFMKGDKVIAWPAKKQAKLAVLEYLASKFKEGKDYTEKEVKETINRYQTFSDHATLRRELYDNYFLNRAPDGSRYWKEKKPKG